MNNDQISEDMANEIFWVEELTEREQRAYEEILWDFIFLGMFFDIFMLIIWRMG